MRELEPLAERAEAHGVLTDDVSRAQREDADLLRRALARKTLPPVDRRLTELAAERLGDDLRHPRCGAARRVLLEAMVDLGDLDVVVIAERAGDDRQDLERERHADRHVGRQHDRGAPRQPGDLVALRPAAAAASRRSAGCSGASSAAASARSDVSRGHATTRAAMRPAAPGTTTSSMTDGDRPRSARYLTRPYVSSIVLRRVRLAS